MSLNDVDMSPEARHNNKVLHIRDELKNISSLVDELKVSEEKIDPGDIRELNIKDLNEIREALGKVYKMIFTGIEFNKHQSFRQMTKLIDDYDNKLLK